MIKVRCTLQNQLRTNIITFKVKKIALNKRLQGVMRRRKSVFKRVVETKKNGKRIYHFTGSRTGRV